MRARIYESPYWKEHCFALSAASILDRAVELDHIGGLYGMQRPSPFLCLLQKLLQIQPEREILREYLTQSVEFKYIRALVAFYVRLTLPSSDVYRLLEPLLEDYRKLRWRDAAGQFTITHMDEFVDDLLRKERVCDIILPRLTKRQTCQDRDGLPPRRSKLHQHQQPSRETLQRDSGSGSSDSENEEDDVARWERTRLVQNDKDELESLYTSQEESSHTDDDQDDTTIAHKRRRFVSPSPSISPDRNGDGSARRPRFASKSPSRSPDRM